MLDIKDRIKKLRQELNIRQKDMANRISVPLTTISKYELGLIRPSSDILSRIAKAFDVNLNWLLLGYGEMFNSSRMMATGTCDAPCLKLIKQGNSFSVQKAECLSESYLEKADSSVANDHNKQMIELAKQLNKPITIEYYDNNLKYQTKVFDPSGSISDSLNDPEQMPDEVDLYRELKYKIKKIKQESSKIELLNLAIDAFEDKEALLSLKNIVENM